MDPASLAYLSGTVKNGDGTYAGWIRSKGEGTTLDLIEGTKVSIGSVEGTVVEINSDSGYIVIETALEKESPRWRVYLGEILSEAYAKGIKD